MEEIKLENILLTDIEVSRTNPRKTFDQTDLDELAESIREKGVLQPILVRAAKKKGKYEIIAGERRYRASLSVNAAFKNRNTIPCIIRVMSDEEAMEVQIIENLQRKDVHPMEEAVGFMHLSTIKKMDAKEIAARVGKTVRYVAQRMKLNELIPEIQECFYKGLLINKDAITIATLSHEDQKRFFESELEDNERPYKMSSWTMDKYRHDLSVAPFDISIDYAGAPITLACVSCPHNSAFNSLFPEDEKKPMCLNGKCFEYKCDYNYAEKLKEVESDPTIILVSDKYSEKSKEVIALSKKGNPIYTRYDYETFDKPEMPERADFDGDNDTSADDEKDYQTALLVYERELKEYHDGVASGKFTQALMVDGNSKGAITYIKLKKTAKKNNYPEAADKKTDSGIDTEAIKNEIQAIKDREKKAKVTDTNKLFAEIKPHFAPVDNANLLSGEFGQTERTAIAKALYNKMGYQITNSTAWKKLIKMPKGTQDYFDTITAEELRKFTRYFMLATLPEINLYNGLTDDAKLCLKLAEEYFPTVVHDIKTKQTEVIEKRVARVDERIKKLQAQLKQKKEVAPNANKVAPNANKVKKKGRGVKALLGDTL